MKFHVNSNCIGCGLCASLCPEVFEMHDGLARAGESDVAGDALSAAESALESCPVSAIEKREHA